MSAPIQPASLGNSEAFPAQILQSLPIINAAATNSLQSLKASLVHLTSEQKRQWANSPDANGKTPLAHTIDAHKPSTLSKMDTIAFLVDECGANPNIADRDGWTPLYRSSSGDKSDAFEFLISGGADITKTNKDGSAPLHRLVDRGSVSDIKFLLSSALEIETTVNAVNCFGTPIAYAAKNGNIPIAEILYNAGADPNLIGDPLDATPVELAENNKKNEMVDFLKSIGGSTIIPLDSAAHTSISLLVHEGNKTSILESFAKGEKDKYGRDAAHYCAALGRTDLLEEMCVIGNIDQPDDKGRTPLFYSVIKGCEEACAYLISDAGKASLTAQDKQGYFPLMFACQYNRDTIANMILKRSETWNKQSEVLSLRDNFGWKAIHKCAQAGNLNLFRLLVEDYHEDYNQLSGDGTQPTHRPPFEIAKATHATNIMDYILHQQKVSFEQMIKKI